MFEKMEKAIRTKLRVQFKGPQSIEELWDLSEDDLDTLYGRLYSEVRDNDFKSLRAGVKKEDEAANLAIDIVTHIYNVKLEERLAREGESMRTERKRKLMEVVADKQDESLKNMSIEDLNKMIDEL